MAPSSPVVTVNKAVPNGVETLGAEKQKLEVLYEGYMYDVTDFVKRHPGGTVILFYTESGEDATHAIQQFHHRSMKKVDLIMKSLPKRPVTDADKFNRDPKYVALSRDFQQLYSDLQREGFFNPSYTHVALRILEVSLLLACIAFIPHFQAMGTFGKVLSSVVGGIFAGRMGWIMHEGGHYSFTGHVKTDRMIETAFLGFGAGMSGSWWRYQHNKHHAMPQRIHHDVDMHSMPLFAFNTKVVETDGWRVNFLVRYQKYLFPILGTFLVVAVWKFFLNPRYAWRKKLYIDMFFMSLHYAAIIYLQISLIYYFIGVWVGSFYMISQFSLNHTHLPVAEEPKHWVEYCLSHTADIEPSWWCDWLMGYLNYQIEHHLFPTMPQFKQRLVQPRVKALAEKHGLPYHCLSYTDAIKATLNNLDKVAMDLMGKDH